MLRPVQKILRALMSLLHAYLFRTENVILVYYLLLMPLC